ncbi:MAG: hypothetical protein LBE82_01940 [Chitinophagaceae bacterium]|jgi:hypothetical protein|nr:hypothetical protein [Chitinophagaceae bacterium]
MQVKKEVLQLVDSCNDDALLMEVKQLLNIENDWWNDLSEKDKNRIRESEMEYEKGNFISHHQLMKDFEEWKKK